MEPKLKLSQLAKQQFLLMYESATHNPSFLLTAICVVLIVVILRIKGRPTNTNKQMSILRNCQKSIIQPIKANANRPIEGDTVVHELNLPALINLTQPFLVSSYGSPYLKHTRSSTQKTNGETCF